MMLVKSISGRFHSICELLHWTTINNWVSMLTIWRYNKNNKKLMLVYCPALASLYFLYYVLVLPQSWLYVCFYCSPPINDYDVFNEGKTQSFFESQQAVMTLCTYLEGVNKNMEETSKSQLLEHFNKLLKVSTLFVTLRQVKCLTDLTEWIGKQIT